MIIRVPDKDVTDELPDFLETCAYCKNCTEFGPTYLGYYFVECKLNKDVFKGCQGKCSDFVDERS